MNGSMMRYVLGKLSLLTAALLGFPLLTALIYREGHTVVFAYLKVIAAALVLGALMSFRKPKNMKLFDKDGLVIVALSWLLFSFLGALPFVLTGEIPSLVDAVFESSSGFTTTGSTILNNVEALSHASLFWRSFTHLIGGMGVLVFALAVVPGIGSESVHLMKAEVPGPVFGKLKSRLRESARVLYLIYLVMTAVLVLLLLAGGMNLFDALIHAFGAAGTGGFSNYNASVGAFNSDYIDVVLSIGMLAFGVNFNLYYLLLITRGKKSIRSEEFLWYAGIVGASTLLITINILPQYTSAGQNYLIALRDSFFSVSSIITTTGYATADFNIWPLFSRFILLLLMFIGACAGSTGGGLKVSRLAILVKSSVIGAKASREPRRALPLRYEDKILGEKEVIKVFHYFLVYLLFFLFCVLLISADTGDFTDAFSAVAATFNNIGPGLGIVGPAGNFSGFSPFSKIILTVAMIAGRLEIYPVLALFAVPENVAALIKKPR